MARAGTVTVDVEGNFDKFEKDAKQSGGRVGKLLGASMATALGVVAAQAVTSLARKLVDMGKEAIEFASKLEVATMAFEQLAGDAGLALLDRLKDIAKETPFQLEPIIQATRLMLGYGIEAGKAGDLMAVVLDNVAAFGGNEDQIHRVALALGQVHAKGRVLGEELRQLNESGIQAQAALAHHLGVNQNEILEMARKGEITVEDLNAALLSTDGPLAKNAGFAVKATDTVIGAMSNLKDAWNIAISDAMLPKLRELTLAIREELQPAVEDAAERLGPSFAEGAATFAEVFAKALPALTTISDAIIRIGTVFGENLLPLIETLSGPLSALAGMFESLFRAVMPFITEILTALGGGIFAILIGVIQALMPVIMTLLPPLTSLLDLIASFIEMFATEAVAILGPFILQLAEGLIPVITELVEGPFTDLVALLMGSVMPAFAQLMPVLGEMIVALLQLALEAIIPLMAALVPVIEEALPILVDLLLALAPLFLENADLISQIIQDLSPLIALVGELTAVGLSALLAILIPLLASFGEWVTQMLGMTSAVTDFITTALEPIIDWLSDMAEAAETAISDFVDTMTGWVDDMRQAGTDAMEGFLTGVASVASNIRSWVKRTIVDPMKRAVTDFFKIGSPSRLMFGYGQDVARGFNLGMEQVGFGVDMGVTGLDSIAASTGIGPVTVVNNGPVGGSMAEFAAQIERQRAIEARFAYG